MAREQDMKRTGRKHGAAFKAKVALAAVKADRTVPSWRARTGFTRTRSTRGRSRPTHGGYPSEHLATLD
jgi:hypothetical protein